MTAKSPINGVPLPEGRRFEPGEEAREKARKGGKASAAARRRKKTLKDELLFLLGEKITDKNGRKHVTQEAISTALIQQALRGNTKAFEIIRDTIGEKPTDKVLLSAPDYSALDAAFALLEVKHDITGQGESADR